MTGPGLARVEPAHLYRPPRAASMATQVAAVARSVGRELDAEQLLAVEVLTGLRADGTPAALESAVVTARQNLKTYVLECIVLALLLDPRNPVRLGVWSAQQMDVAAETFRTFAGWFESSDFPHLRRRHKRTLTTFGREELELTTGARLKFKARSGKGGRGLSGDFVVLDEAFALDESHMGALLPTLSTRRRAWVLYGSSAGRPESGVLRRVRDRGRGGGPGAPAYIEWCAPGSFKAPGCELDGCGHEVGAPGCALDREDHWQAANPALGKRITVEYVRSERAALSAREFARERLGWWDDPEPAAARRIPAEVWAAGTVPTPHEAEVGEPEFGVAVSWDRSAAALAVAYWLDGRPTVEVVRHERGTRWVVAACAGVQDRWPGSRFAIVPTTAAGSLAAELEDAGLSVVRLSAGDHTAACGRLWDEATAEPPVLAHLDDSALAAAVAGAETRERGDGGFVWWSADSTTDISPLAAVTVARSLLVEGYDLLESVL